MNKLIFSILLISTLFFHPKSGCAQNISRQTLNFSPAHFIKISTQFPDSVWLKQHIWQYFRTYAPQSDIIEIVATKDEVMDNIRELQDYVNTKSVFEYNPAKIKSHNCRLEAQIENGTDDHFELRVRVRNLKKGTEEAFLAREIPYPDDEHRLCAEIELENYVMDLITQLDRNTEEKFLRLKAVPQFCEKQKINILIADLINETGDVDSHGQESAQHIHSMLLKMLNNKFLNDIIDVRCLKAKMTGEYVKNDAGAKRIAKKTNANIVIWGLIWKQSNQVFYTIVANFFHNAYFHRDTGGPKKDRITDAKLSDLIGTDAEAVLEYIIGWTFSNNDQYKHFELAFDYLKEAVNKTSKEVGIPMLRRSAQVAIQMREYPLAEEWLVQLLKSQQQAEDDQGMAETYGDMSVLCSEQGNAKGAKKFREKSRKIMKKIELKQRTEFSDYKFSISDLDEPLNMKRRDFEDNEFYYSLRGHNRLIQQHCRNVIHMARNRECDRAVYIFDRNLKNARNQNRLLKPGQLAYLQKEIGMCFVKQEEPNIALSYFLEARNSYRETKNKEKNAQLTLWIAGIYLVQKEWPEAKIEAFESKTIYEGLNDLKGIGLCYYCLGYANFKQKQYEVAQIYTEKSIEILKGLDEQGLRQRAEKLLREIKKN